MLVYGSVSDDENMQMYVCVHSVAVLNAAFCILAVRCGLLNFIDELENISTTK